MRFFTSDTHYFHETLLENNDFAPRSFQTVQQMHQTMITNWNRVVSDKDVVYHLGDVAMHPRYEKGFPEILAILCQLKGKIVFVKGNHDTRTFFKFLAKHDPLMADGTPKFTFEDVGALIKSNRHQYYLTHYPMILGVTRNIRNLHGHIHHSSIPFADNLNVGVDAPELAFLAEKVPFGTPISENQLDELADRKREELEKLRM